jgi:hypothetical protein
VFPSNTSIATGQPSAAHSHRARAADPGSSPSVGGQIARGGELGSGRDQAAGDQGDRQGCQALVAGLAEQPVQADRPDCPQHRGGMAVRQGAADEDAILGDGDAALEQRAKTFDQRAGPIRQVGQGALPDPTLLAKALAQQDGGGRAPIGHRFDIHGGIICTLWPYFQAKLSVLHGYIRLNEMGTHRRNPGFYALRCKNFGLGWHSRIREVPHKSTRLLRTIYLVLT